MRERLLEDFQLQQCYASRSRMDSQHLDASTVYFIDHPVADKAPQWTASAGSRMMIRDCVQLRAVDKAGRGKHSVLV
jgi:hypothetical protein